MVILGIAKEEFSYFCHTEQVRQEKCLGGQTRVNKHADSKT